MVRCTPLIVECRPPDQQRVKCGPKYADCFCWPADQIRSMKVRTTTDTANLKQNVLTMKVPVINTYTQHTSVHLFVLYHGDKHSHFLLQNVAVCQVVLATLKKVKKVQANIADIALRGNPISELQDVNCHTGSHSVTCQLTQVNAPRLTPSMQAGTRFTYAEGMEGWVYLHCVSKKVHPYHFHDNNVKWKPIQIIFSSNVADEICNKNIWNKCLI